jgi:hypothetical protein
MPHGRRAWRGALARHQDRFGLASRAKCNKSGGRGKELDYWIIGLLDYWIIGLLDYWIDGFMDEGMGDFFQ